MHPILFVISQKQIGSVWDAAAKAIIIIIINCIVFDLVDGFAAQTPTQNSSNNNQNQWRNMQNEMNTKRNISYQALVAFGLKC